MKIKGLNSKIKGAIFDMDGLLINSEYLYWQANIQAAKEYNLSIPDNSYLELIGASNEIMDKFYQKYFLTTDDKNRFIDRTNELVWEWTDQGKLKLNSGVKIILDLFKENNIKMAVASSNEDHVIKHDLNKLKCRSYFDFYLSMQDVLKHELKPKPAPDIYLLAKNKMHLEKDELIVFEDSSVGVAAATNAGLNCVMIPDLVKASQQDENNALYICNNFREFKKLLD